MRPTTFRVARQWLSFYAARVYLREVNTRDAAWFRHVQETLSIRCTIAVIYRRGSCERDLFSLADILQSLRQLLCSIKRISSLDLRFLVKRTMHVFIYEKALRPNTKCISKERRYIYIYYCLLFRVNDGHDFSIFTDSSRHALGAAFSAQSAISQISPDLQQTSVTLRTKMYQNNPRTRVHVTWSVN